ncbi:OmpA family protein [Gangjinia marincola]
MTGKTRQIILLVLFVVFTAQPSFSQNTRLERANREYERLSYIKAQRLYLKVVEDGYRGEELFQKLGDTYYYNGDFKGAAKWYGELMEEFSEFTDPEYYFRYAQSLKSLRDYDASDQWMKRFIAARGDDTRSALFTENQDYLEQISYQSGRYEIDPVSINSEFSEFGSAFYDKKVVFASTRDTGTFTRKINKWNNQAFLDLYTAEADSIDGDLSNVKKIKGDVNTIYHESTPVFTKDGKTMYFTRNNYNDGEYRQDKKFYNRLKIYKATFNDLTRSWDRIEELPFNSDDYAVAHPALSPDEKKLFFASDMPGTVGQSDIFCVEIYDDNTYGKPMRLPGEINTEGRETFPYVSEKGYLYFASDGHPGLGGLDIFVTSLTVDNKVGEIVNVGEPANSPDDDFAFAVSDVSKRGYLTSNREGGQGGDDIYTFQQKKLPRNLCRVVVTGIVTDTDTGEKLPGAEVKLIEEETKETLEQTIVGEEANYAFVADCDTEYTLRAERDGYISQDRFFVTPEGIEEFEQSIALTKEVQNEVDPVDLETLLSLEPIYFDFDKSKVREPDATEAMNKIVAILKKYPKLEIEISSHTDSRGSKKYNEGLSERRANQTKEYLLNNGLEAERIVAKGYGETQLLNECADGVPCSKEKHQLNRRSEFTILFKIKGE